ncbi:Uncharacterised protein [uncultured Clostridium sp.]|uniref:hypothetical protein n=1 Tax=uncultured Clostridium sp. TaxID=59620 RepID=UPI00082298AF|nr:hypothetical protein [uncultured Clostridium sp.]SCJ89607.1 Uncharacterised protein [uncultured Clostridium sp.]
MSKNIYRNISTMLVCLLILPVKPAYAFYSVNNAYINSSSPDFSTELSGYFKKIQPIYNELYYLGESVYSALIKKQNAENLINQIDYEIANLNSIRENLFMLSNNTNISSTEQGIALGILITTGYYKLAYQSLRIALTTKDSAMQIKYLEDFFRYNTLGSTTLNSIEKNINL